jgi:D-alanine-D-alanine ligase
VFRDEDSLRARVSDLFAAQRCESVVVESYVEGREYVMGLLGERRPRVLPPMEVLFDPAVEFPYLSNRLDRAGVAYQVPAEVTPGVGRALARVARLVFAALGFRDLARVVLRVDAAGQVYFISCSPLPALSPGKADLARIAAAAGIDFRTLIHEILAPALRRLREARRSKFASEGIEP